MMTTTRKVTIPYQPRSLQSELHQELEAHRFSVIVIHRRFGKTYMLLNHIIKDALTTDKPNPRYAYIAPFFKQAKILAWDYLKRFCDGIPGRKFSESECAVTLPNGAVIRLFGADNPDALRGLYLDGVVLDEYAQINPKIYSSIIRPALSDRYGWCVFSGTPNGRNDFFEKLQQAKASDSWFWCILKASETGIVPDEELADARRTMTDEEYEREYECSFDSIIGKKIYPEFNIHIHVALRSIFPTEATTIYRGWDNTGLHPGITLSYLSPIGQWCIFQEFWFDDVGAAESAETVITWCNLSLPYGCKFVDYGDPAGQNRDGNKMSNRDYIAIQAQKMGQELFIEDGIQSWKVRRESVANKLRTLRNGQSALLVDPECTLVIEGFSGGFAYRGLANMPGHFVEEAIKNKYADIHDSLQYKATRMFTTGDVVGSLETSANHTYPDDDYAGYNVENVGRNLTTGY